MVEVSHDRKNLEIARLIFWPLVTVLIATIFSLVTPLMVRILIDALVTNGRSLHWKIPMWDATWILLAVLLVSNLIDAGLSFTRGILVDRNATRYVRGEAMKAIESALYQPFSNMAGKSGRETAQTISEVLYIRDCIAETLSVIARTTLALALYSAVLIWLNFYLSMAAILVLFPLQAIIFLLFSRRAAKSAYGAVRKSAEFGGYLNSAMLAVETIRSYGFTERHIAGLRALMNDVLDRVLRARHIATIHQTLSQLSSRSIEAVLLIVGARAVISGTMTLGDVIMFRMILARIVDPLSRLGTNLDRFQRARVQLKQWDSLALTREVSSADHVDAGAPVHRSIVFRGVSVFYGNNQQPALHEISLHIDGGEIVFLLGPSGSGKSTIVRLLSGLLAPDDGTVHIAGHAPSVVTDAARARLVACAFQQPMLVPGTIEDNIRCFDPSMPVERIIEAAEIAGVAPFLTKLPSGLQTKVDTAGEALSGGERQRVCIARMIAAQPKLMVIDEATSGLERALEVNVIQRLIRAMRPNQSILIVTHREDLAALGTRIIRLDEGRVVEDKPS